MIRKVFDIRDVNLADVPARLRMLADELEGRGIRGCAIVIDFTDDTLDIPAFGHDADQLRVLGLLHLGAATLASNLIEAGRQDGGRDPGTAA
ncbi:MAG: hypothetical protein AB7I42_25985 [Bradyrhizobium sp.]|uniref:hypothetical protein n=1 Tax=Bradyrhizobium sp. TaxID=376 RepID=UPI003D09D1A6